jgi:N4-(beta-N-acetylglucosaminyl)-L-asparaginase
MNFESHTAGSNSDKEKAKTLQVGFLALNKKGQYGAYAIQKGFVFSVKSNSEERVIESKYIYDLGAT